jgi:hypothetical protein
MVTAGGLRRRAGSRFPSLGRESGCGDLMVAEGVGDDRGGHLKDVLADRGGPAGDGGNAEVTTSTASAPECTDWPARRPGNSQRELRFVAVFGPRTGELAYSTVVNSLLGSVW